MRINVKNLLVAAAALVILASTAMAQTGFGVRAGATVDPDQFHFGAHYITDDLLDRLHFRPNLKSGWAAILPWLRRISSLRTGFGCLIRPHRCTSAQVPP